MDERWREAGNGWRDSEEGRGEIKEVERDGGRMKKGEIR